jgi:hypothetical protein
MRKHPIHPLNLADDPAVPVEEGPCAICHARPAEVFGLVCGVCKDAIDNDEPWTHAHAETIERLNALEAEEERSASPSGQG